MTAILTTFRDISASKEQVIGTSQISVKSLQKLKPGVAIQLNTPSWDLDHYEVAAVDLEKGEIQVKKFQPQFTIPIQKFNEKYVDNFLPF